jgi:hypothetical protein
LVVEAEQLLLLKVPPPERKTQLFGFVKQARSVLGIGKRQASGAGLVGLEKFIRAGLAIVP